MIRVEGKSPMFKIHDYTLLYRTPPKPNKETKRTSTIHSASSKLKSIFQSWFDSSAGGTKAAAPAASSEGDALRKYKRHLDPICLMNTIAMNP